MSDDYERREVSSFLNEVRAIDRLPLSERKENAARFAHDLKHDPALVAERVGWLLDGSYGYGAKVQADQIVSRPRMNREAALVMMTAAAEWRVPSRMVAASWHKLTPEEKKKLGRLLKKELPAAKRKKRKRARRVRSTLLVKRKR